MALEIKNIPTIRNKAAVNFEKKVEAAKKARKSISFKKEVDIAKSILSKAKI